MNIKYIISIILFFLLFVIIFNKKTISKKLQIYSLNNPIDRCSLKYDRNKVYEFNNLLTKEECNTIIKLAEPKLEKSTVLNKEKFHSGRTSSHVFLISDNNSPKLNIP